MTGLSWGRLRNRWIRSQKWFKLWCGSRFWLNHDLVSTPGYWRGLQLLCRWEFVVDDLLIPKKLALEFIPLSVPTGLEFTPRVRAFGQGSEPLPW
jgi:hypothetical protein